MVKEESLLARSGREKAGLLLGGVDKSGVPRSPRHKATAGVLDVGHRGWLALLKWERVRLETEVGSAKGGAKKNKKPLGMGGNLKSGSLSSVVGSWSPSETICKLRGGRVRGGRGRRWGAGLPEVGFVLNYPEGGAGYFQLAS